MTIHATCVKLARAGALSQVARHHDEVRLEGAHAAAELLEHGGRLGAEVQVGKVSDASHAAGPRAPLGAPLALALMPGCFSVRRRSEP